VSDSINIQWLSAAVAQTTKSARFCASGAVPIANPGLDVDGLGPIALPLKRGMAKSLIACCHVAPYGQGTRTVIDLDVRNTHELNPEKFRLSEAWNTAIAAATRSAAAELGLPPDRLEARLYKLLVYEKGGKFLSHRDSEKHDRMVASMIVVLPNAFEGGELRVRHGTSEQILKFADAAAGKSACYAAFYADCEHEVMRVHRGHRLCLAYNLVLKPQRNESPAPAASRTPVASLAESITTWIATQPARPLVFALEHHYTEHGLSLDLLKGGDRQLADLIVPAADQAGCVVHLSQVERHLMQFADDGSFERDYRRSYRNYEPSRRKITIGETYEDDLYGKQWTDLEGKKEPWGTIAFDRPAIVSAIPLDDWKPTTEEFEGYTGNAGNTLDRWYHRSALVVWHRDHHFDVIATCGSANSIPLFSAMAARLAKTPKKQQDEARHDCIRFARAIITTWPTRVHRHLYPAATATPPEEDFAESLLLLHDRDVIAAFLSKLAERDKVLPLDKLVLAASREFGGDAFTRELQQLLSARPDWPGREEIPARDVAWLSAFCCDAKADAGPLPVATALCAVAVKRFCEPFESSRPSRVRPEREQTECEAALSLLAKAVAATGCDETLAQLLAFVQQHPKEFRLGECQVPALKVLIPWAKKRFGAVPLLLASWRATVQRTLESLTAAEPSPPADWGRPAKVDCQCEFCAQLKAFLADPASETCRIPAREDRRDHLLRKIDQHQCDVKHTLDQKRSPYVLVLTKTTGSFDRALKQFHTDQKLLATLPTIPASQ
jgi:hypothetical protein